MSLQVQIGIDPECFIKEKSTGRIVSAHDLLPGTKDKPYPVEHGAVQVDGVAAEFNITPSLDAQSFTTSISAVTGKLQSMIGDKYELLWEPVCDFPEDYFKTLPEGVRELGCNPDFNAWTGQVNPRPDGLSTLMRTAAGHVHIGWYPKGKEVDPTDPVHFDDCRAVAKQLDYYLGMYSLMWDPDTRRRNLYGKAGSFRPKPYGMEYRALSNVWLRSQKLQSWVWNSAYRAVIDLVQGGNCIEDKLGDLARKAIDGNEKWWEDEKHPAMKLPLLTNLKNPPPLPKPGEIPEKEDLEIILTGCLSLDEYYSWAKANPQYFKGGNYQAEFSPIDNQYILRKMKNPFLKKVR